MNGKQGVLVATVAVTLGLNGVILAKDVYDKATDIDADGHELIGLSHSSSATAAIRMADAVQLQAEKTPAAVTDAGNRPT